jgi:hypothetical protein
MLGMRRTALFLLGGTGNRRRWRAAFDTEKESTG